MAQAHGHGLLRSFAWAWAGLASAARRERNFRIHLGAGVLAACFTALAPLEPVARALVLAFVALVLAAEALNSALEAAVDLASPGEHRLAGHAKDAAAGAVLVLSVASVLAFGIVARPALPALAGEAGRLWPAALGAGLAAAAASGLPALRPRAGIAPAVAGLVGLAWVAVYASAQSGTVAAALLLAVAIAASRR